MAGAKSKSARIVAAATLNRFDPQRDYAGQILDKLLYQTEEKQRATDLVFGTLRNRFAIDMVISKLADCPTERIPEKLLNIIRIGAYELIYSTATGEYAIVDEAAEAAKKIAGKKQTGFVNALLRQITRHIQNRQKPLSQSDAQKTLPQTPESGCEFDMPILPNPADLPADYFSIAFSLPKWLISDWLAQSGIEQVRQICFASNRRPSLYIRPNTLKTTTSRLAEKLLQANINLEITADESMIRIKGAQAITGLPGFEEGLFSVQDITACQITKLLKPQSGWAILDLCAAPGVKTTQLAELTDDKATIVATDIDGVRLQKVKENISRLGIKSVSVVAYKQLKQKSAEAGFFDAVLLDVPCSNTGVLSRRPEVRYRIKPQSITELAKTQSKLLDAAAMMLKPNGKICYSTCSIQKDENGELVRQFLQKHSNLELETELLILPSSQKFDCDGGYAAIIARK